ncbi:MAG: 50S ribosomal protein L25/general stress protein Ctc [Gammaproteobacteria bacterium]|nr:50S ribosomal protein L25/general stress protein Ctc [Gammaproteobacteria bacterium]MYD02791.1 50S ribosomal protein L25/general stress protein Ctc [Gammaproteobacteria bacterium]MYI26230.1 50S ribosomal protein L25/general stress protein Ctc [Gammaproteobacteria bacterium]
MATMIDLEGELREGSGKRSARRARREGKAPAVLYGAGRPARMLSFSSEILNRRLEDPTFRSRVLNIRVGDKSQPAIVKDVQRHPSRNAVLHIDLQRVREEETIRMAVPISLLNADASPGVKMGGSVSHLLNELHIICLPKDLPEQIEVDLGEVDLDEMLHLSDLDLPEGVAVNERVHGDTDHPVVSIALRRVAEVDEPEEDEELLDEEAEAAEGEEAPAEEESSGEG